MAWRSSSSASQCVRGMLTEVPIAASPQGFLPGGLACAPPASPQAVLTGGSTCASGRADVGPPHRRLQLGHAFALGEALLQQLHSFQLEELEELVRLLGGAASDEAREFPRRHASDDAVVPSVSEDDVDAVGLADEEWYWNDDGLFFEDFDASLVEGADPG